MALTYTPEGELGFQMPLFDLPATDQTHVTEKYFDNAKGGLVMFICNHCPYVQAIEERLIQLAIDLRPLSIKVIGISSNDVNSYPEDSFEKMKVRALEKNYSFPFLYDESQSVARAFGAVCTPDFFLFNNERKLVYRGRLDDSWKDSEKVQKRELYEACLNLSENKPLPLNSKASMGCSIKWK